MGLHRLARQFKGGCEKCILRIGEKPVWSVLDSSLQVRRLRFFPDPGGALPQLCFICSDRDLLVCFLEKEDPERPVLVPDCSIPVFATVVSGRNGVFTPDDLEYATGDMVKSARVLHLFLFPLRADWTTSSHCDCVSLPGIGNAVYPDLCFLFHGAIVLSDIVRLE